MERNKVTHTDYDIGAITRSLELVRKAMARWGETADETAEVFRAITAALVDDDLDETSTWCTVRGAIARADSEGGWSHLRLRDDLVGALAGIEGPVPLTGYDDGTESLIEVPEIGDIKPGEECDDV